MTLSWFDLSFASAENYWQYRKLDLEIPKLHTPFNTCGTGQSLIIYLAMFLEVAVTSLLMILNILLTFAATLSHFLLNPFCYFFNPYHNFPWCLFFFPGVGRPCTQIFPVQWKYPTEVRARPLILRLCRTHCEQKITDVLGGLSSVKTTIYFIFVSIQFWYFIVQGITSRFALQILQETNFRQHIFTAKT